MTLRFESPEIEAQCIPYTVFSQWNPNQFWETFDASFPSTRPKDRYATLGIFLKHGEHEDTVSDHALLLTKAYPIEMWRIGKGWWFSREWSVVLFRFSCAGPLKSLCEYTLKNRLADGDHIRLIPDRLAKNTVEETEIHRFKWYPTDPATPLQDLPEEFKECVDRWTASYPTGFLGKDLVVVVGAERKTLLETYLHIKKAGDHVRDYRFFIGDPRVISGLRFLLPIDMQSDDLANLARLCLVLGPGFADRIFIMAKEDVCALPWIADGTDSERAKVDPFFPSGGNEDKVYASVFEKSGL
jgi:hypothetical protein